MTAGIIIICCYRKQRILLNMGLASQPNEDC